MGRHFYSKERLTNNGDSDLGLRQTFSEDELSEPITAKEDNELICYPKRKKFQFSSAEPGFWKTCIHHCKPDDFPTSTDFYDPISVAVNKREVLMSYAEMCPRLEDRHNSVN